MIEIGPNLMTAINCIAFASMFIVLFWAMSRDNRKHEDD